MNSKGDSDVPRESIIFIHENQETLNSRIVLVVPCFNEFERWDKIYWDSLASIESLQLIFVDDGSTDDTWLKISEVAGKENVSTCRLTKNVGKAEALRSGLIQARKINPIGIGFLDADASFPVSEVQRVFENFRYRAFERNEIEAIWSARVKLSGHKIDRNTTRHYFSRILLTLLSWINPFDLYDSQSGFKLFVNGDFFDGILNQPFRTRWFVDLEIYYRWKKQINNLPMIWEEPITGWRDVSGSKIRGRQLLQVMRDIATLVFCYR